MSNLTGSDAVLFRGLTWAAKCLRRFARRRHPRPTGGRAVTEAMADFAIPAEILESAECSFSGFGYRQEMKNDQ